MWSHHDGEPGRPYEQGKKINIKSTYPFQRKHLSLPSTLEEVQCNSLATKWLAGLPGNDALSKAQ